MLWFHVLFLGRAEGEPVIFGVVGSWVVAAVLSLESGVGRDISAEEGAQGGPVLLWVLLNLTGAPRCSWHLHCSVLPETPNWGICL